MNFKHKNPSKGYVALRKRKNLKDRLRLELDTEWSKAVKDKADQVCEYCGKTDRLQSHHVFTRSIKAVRWNVDNGVCLCAGHHIFFAHKKPEAFRDWIIGKRGQEWFDNIKLLSRIK